MKLVLLPDMDFGDISPGHSWSPSGKGVTEHPHHPSIVHSSRKFGWTEHLRKLLLSWATEMAHPRTTRVAWTPRGAWTNTKGSLQVPKDCHQCHVRCFRHWDRGWWTWHRAQRRLAMEWWLKARPETASNTSVYRKDPFLGNTEIWATATLLSSEDGKPLGHETPVVVPVPTPLQGKQSWNLKVSRAEQ